MVNSTVWVPCGSQLDAVSTVWVPRPPAVIAAPMQVAASAGGMGAPSRRNRNWHASWTGSGIPAWLPLTPTRAGVGEGAGAVGVATDGAVVGAAGAGVDGWSGRPEGNAGAVSWFLICSAVGPQDASGITSGSPTAMPNSRR
ncbi:hypothetical protein KKR91_09180 [Arthrobacter jiangjiafuii]|uniref:Uncharacterized protein n=1 Tax=Arthrobacter jiangjiafuii TaxID=2817475 RepID=A0A975M3E1_9MICC|nr:hypothetical protein [Arthrobacter jiangjiafuii]QWC08726.1 hypothetical protein KKR91_09180 [Arthrobacter jiangjiafuii]